MDQKESLKINHTGRKVFPYKGYLVPVATKRSRYIQYYQINQLNPKFMDKLNALVGGTDFTVDQQHIGATIKDDLRNNWEISWKQFHLVMNQRKTYSHEPGAVPKKMWLLKGKRKTW